MLWREHGAALTRDNQAIPSPSSSRDPPRKDAQEHPVGHTDLPPALPQSTWEHGASTGAATWQDRQGTPLRRNTTRPTLLSTPHPKARPHTPPRAVPALQEGAGPCWVSRSGAGTQGLARTVPPCTALHPACWNLLTGLAPGIRALHCVRKIRA